MGFWALQIGRIEERDREREKWGEEGEVMCWRWEMSGSRTRERFRRGTPSTRNKKKKKKGTPPLLFYLYNILVITLPKP